jgi:predicted nucleic acid-binding protein
MRLVIDTNVLIAALLKDSTIRLLLLSPKFTFYLPRYSFKEVEKCQEPATKVAGV